VRIYPGPRQGLTVGAMLLLLALLSGVCHGAELKLSVSGLGRETRQNLLAHLGSVDSSMLEQPARLERLVQSAIDDALQPFGYHEASFTLASKNGALQIAVTPGPRVRLGEPRISVDEPAASVPEIAALLAKPPLLAGAAVSHARYDAFRDQLLRTCRRLGFFDARYRHSELRIDVANRTAEAWLDLESGPRYVFDETSISGTDVNPELLHVLAPFSTGDPFDNELVMRFERRLRDTGWFREMALTVQPGTDGRVLVTVLAEDMRSSHYDIGAGFSTDSALRLRFNRNTPLRNNDGHSLRIESEISEPRQNVEAVYRIPHHDPLDDILEFTAGLQGKNIQDTDTKTGTLGVRHALKIFGDWSHSYGISAELERYSLGSDSSKDVAYLMPALNLSRTRLARGIDPLNGTAFWAAVDFSDRAVGSPSDFMRWRGSAKWLFALPDANTTVLTRLEMGTIITDGFNSLPASLRFYAGGDNSIRGYDVESLGPRDSEGKLVGGRYLTVGSFEISRRVKPTWRVAAFIDGGGAFTEDHDKLYQSVGLGLRWLSPIGQIRVDLATPIQDRENSGFKLHISMGPPL
jgi:translocation and assembly module TamA